MNLIPPSNGKCRPTDNYSNSRSKTSPHRNRSCSIPSSHAKSYHKNLSTNLNYTHQFIASSNNIVLFIWRSVIHLDFRINGTSSTWLHTGNRIGIRSDMSCECIRKTFQWCSCICCTVCNARCLGRTVIAHCRNRLHESSGDISDSIVFYICCISYRWTHQFKCNLSNFTVDTFFDLGVTWPFHIAKISCTFPWLKEEVPCTVLTLDPINYDIRHWDIIWPKINLFCKSRIDEGMRNKRNVSSYLSFSETICEGIRFNKCYTFLDCIFLKAFYWVLTYWTFFLFPSMWNI